jgi:hypothetical protein
VWSSAAPLGLLVDLQFLTSPRGEKGEAAVKVPADFFELFLGQTDQEPRGVVRK